MEGGKAKVEVQEKKTYIDLLDEDRPLAGQKFVCVSFVSPEKIIKDKHLFRFQKFIKHHDRTKTIEKFTSFLNFIAYTYNFSFDDLMADFKEFTKEEQDDLYNNQIEDDYKNFIDENEEALDGEYNALCDFQTNVRGLKIRGTYATMQEAELRCKMLQQVDPNHNVYVGPVGMWMPWEPEAYKTGRVEYLEEKLNKLMHEKKRNDTEAKKNFDKRVLETKMKAIEDNKAKAEKTGNMLTQDISERGNLFGKRTTTTEKALGDNATVSDIHAEIFDKEDALTATETNQKKKKKRKKKKKK